MIRVVEAIRTRECHTCGDAIPAGKRHARVVCSGWKTSPVNTCLKCLKKAVKEIEGA